MTLRRIASSPFEAQHDVRTSRGLHCHKSTPYCGDRYICNRDELCFLPGRNSNFMYGVGSDTCHGSSGQSPASHCHVSSRGACGGQVALRHVILSVFLFPLSVSFHQCVHLRVQVALTRRTNGGSLGTFKQSAIRDEVWKGKLFHVVSCFLVTKTVQLFRCTNHILKQL